MDYTTIAAATGVAAGLLWLSSANRAAMLAPVEVDNRVQLTDIAAATSTTDDFLYRARIPSDTVGRMWSQVDVVTPDDPRWNQAVHSRTQFEQDWANLRQ